ncbi:hypothetical protein CR513_12125, partial [Mucuna pruriens]
MENPLYTRCTNFMRLLAVLSFFNLKAKTRLNDKSFTNLFELLKDMLSKENILPNLSSDALVFEVWESHYIKKYDDCSSDISTKGPLMKVLWYLPIVSRYKRLFINSNDAKNFI